ncbi:hypothetical protein JXD38_09940 [candidate division WOR-3 bacterium]|nr:hypothetical protein [candidate division WOR-3 bacterium]
MNQIELDQETRDLLDRVRHSRRPLCLFEMPADLAEAAVWENGRTLPEPTQLPLSGWQFSRTQDRRAEKNWANSVRQPADITAILSPG